MADDNLDDFTQELDKTFDPIIEEEKNKAAATQAKKTIEKAVGKTKKVDPVKIGNVNLKEFDWEGKEKKKLTIIGRIATTFSLIGIVLCGLKVIWCWPVWIVSNFFWIYWAIKKKVWSQVILWVAFLLLNVFSWYMWYLN